MISLLLAVTLAFSLTACGAKQSDARVNITATAFPIYDWVRNVVGDVPGVEITWLMDSGVDPHSFQPSVDDLLQVTNSDVFVFVGGESDAWIEDALPEMTKANPDACAVPLLMAIGLAAVEEEAEPGVMDEHIWMSLKNAQVCVQAIAKVLAASDPDYADDYRTNAEAYTEQLRQLDQDYANTVEMGEKHAIVVADRFPFRYLAEDYGLDWYAAFSGCSAESEASFQTVMHLAEQTDTLGLPVILITENGSGDIAEAVVDASESRPAVRTLDSLQSVTAEIADGGVTYLSIMENNLDVLKEALVCRS